MFHITHTYMCHMTHSYVYRNVFMCDGTDSCVWHDSLNIYIYMCSHIIHICIIWVMCMTAVFVACLFALCVKWLIHMCMTWLYMIHMCMTWLLHIWYICVWHDFFIYDTYVYDMTSSYVWSDCSLYVWNHWFRVHWLTQEMWLMCTYRASQITGLFCRILSFFIGLFCKRDL